MHSGTVGNEHVPAPERVLGQDLHTQMRVFCHCDLFSSLTLCTTSAQLFLCFHKTHKMPWGDWELECIKVLFPILKDQKEMFSWLL